MNLDKHIAAILCVLFMVLPMSTYAQGMAIGPNVARTLDSLLLEGNVETFLSQWEQSSRRDQSDSYSVLSSRLRELTQASEQRMQETCQEEESSGVLFCRAAFSKPSCPDREAQVADKSCRSPGFISGQGIRQRPSKCGCLSGRRSGKSGIPGSQGFALRPLRRS